VEILYSLINKMASSNKINKANNSNKVNNMICRLTKNINNSRHEMKSINQITEEESKNKNKTMNIITDRSHLFKIFLCLYVLYSFQIVSLFEVASQQPTILKAPRSQNMSKNCFISRFMHTKLA